MAAQPRIASVEACSAWRQQYLLSDELISGGCSQLGKNAALWLLRAERALRAEGMEGAVLDAVMGWASERARDSPSSPNTL